MKKTLLVLLLVIIGFSASSCHKAKKLERVEEKPAYDTPLAPGALALRKITNPAEIPDFTIACYDLLDMKTALAKSLNYLSKPSSETRFPIGDVTHQRAVDSLKEFQSMLESGLRGDKLNAAIREKFDVYISVGCDNKGLVLFTGYYTPIFDGSMTKTEKFKYPLYKMPPDLVKDEKGEILGRQVGEGKYEPFPARQELEKSSMLNGLELIYLGDPFEVYIAHVQGSAEIRLPNGRLTGVGYAANNGHEYKSMAKEMLSQGKFGGKQMSLSAMIAYFKEHPDEVASFTALNPRYVFFMEQKGKPRGSLNEEVTPLRSVATDKSIFPPASLTFISTKLPYEKDGTMGDRVFTNFAFDQDTGGAIRAPGRCDIYIGIGDEAGKRAGGIYQEGKLYYLFLKN
jgi:membrane-bound lytic murein transglycosylase A